MKVLRALTLPMDEAEESSLLDTLDAHNNLMTIRKCVCDTLRGMDLPNIEIRGLLTAEALATRALERALFPKGVHRGEES